MSSVIKPSKEDMDALHILPLGIVPLETQGLARARLIKNSRLEGVVELYAGQETGSGQITPHDLDKVFDLAGDARKDLDTVVALSDLPTYDVYSLRTELSRLGIEPDADTELKLSDDKVRAIANQMQAFTRPLVSTVFGEGEGRDKTFDDILVSMNGQDRNEILKNLSGIADKLEVELASIPDFLADYRDVFQSLAFYQNCLDENIPEIHTFMETISSIADDRELRKDSRIMGACALIEEKMASMVSQVSYVLEILRINTTNMWRDLSASRYRDIKKVITEYQVKIGSALCAISVKMLTWLKSFPDSGAGSLNRRASFIADQMQPGLENIDSIKYVKLAA